MTLVVTVAILGLVTGSVYGLAAVGLVLTYRTSGVFNFAHGTVAAVGAYVFYVLRQQHGVPWPFALIIAVLVVGPLVGFLLEGLSRRLTNASIVWRVVATVGLLIALQQVAVLVFGGATRSFDPFLPTGTFGLGGARVGYDNLIVFVVALAATVGLTLLLRVSRLGASMRGVVDNASLITLTGTNPAAVRRRAWAIGCAFASLSGVLLAPTIGLDAGILTLLVVQAFGAAALGLFRSLPLAYLGGLVIGVGAAVLQHYVQTESFLRPLNGLPASLPFLLLFLVLIFAPRRRLVDIAPERRRPLPQRASLPPLARAIVSGAGITVLLLVPTFAGTRLITYNSGVAYVVIFLSLLLLDRYSGQLSLAQLAFCAVGGTAFAHFTGGLGLPWLVAVLLGGLIAVPVGVLLAVPAVRLSGLYLALATFGFGLLMQNLFYGQSYMFGTGRNSISTPRPSFAQSDTGYYYVLLAFALLAVALVMGIRRSSLGRLLRAMADSPTALATGGMNVTALRVTVFCISAFIAGVGGALLGPVTGELSSTNLDTFSSLLLVVILALQAYLPDVPAVFVAAFASQVLPGYLVSHQTWHDILPVLFGAFAVLVAMVEGGRGEGAGSARSTASATGRPSFDERLRRSPIRARTAERQQVVVEVMP